MKRTLKILKVFLRLKQTEIRALFPSLKSWSEFLWHMKMFYFFAAILIGMLTIGALVCACTGSIAMGLWYRLFPDFVIPVLQEEKAVDRWTIIIAIGLFHTVLFSALYSASKSFVSWIKNNWVEASNIVYSEERGGN